MAFKYTEDQLNKMDKTLLIELFLGLQDQRNTCIERKDAADDGTVGIRKTTAFWEIHRTHGRY